MIKCVGALAAICGLAAISPITVVAAVADNPYAPLELYAGRWTVTSSDGKITAVENRCARTGLFFACEQVVNGAAAALVVFLPRGRTGAGETYRTQALRADGATPGAWSDLTIAGDDWTYAQAGPAVRQRTLNHFSGSDHIHYEVQSSIKGKTWKTRTSGDEQRAP